MTAVLELGESVHRGLVMATVAWKLRLQGGGSNQAGSTVPIWSLPVFGTRKGSSALPWPWQLRQRTTASSLGESFLHGRLHIQLWLLLIVLVDVLAQLFLFTHHAGTSVAQDRATNGSKSPNLDAGEDADGSAEAHAHQGPDHGQAGHGDRGVVVVGVVIFHLLTTSRLDCSAILEGWSEISYGLI